MDPRALTAITEIALGIPLAVSRVPSIGSTATSHIGPLPSPTCSPLYSIGALSFSPSPMTTTPFIETVLMSCRIAFTAAPSAPFLSPRPTHRADAIAPASVTLASSMARLRSGACLPGSGAAKEACAAPPGEPATPGAPATPLRLPSCRARPSLITSAFPVGPPDEILCNRLAAWPAAQHGRGPEPRRMVTEQTAHAGRTADRGASTRATLLAAAREVFMQHGYAQAAITDIVALAGASVGSLYHHFAGKAELYLALFGELNAARE